MSARRNWPYDNSRGRRLAIDKGEEPEPMSRHLQILEGRFIHETYAGVSSASPPDRAPDIDRIVALQFRRHIAHRASTPRSACRAEPRHARSARPARRQIAVQQFQETGFSRAHWHRTPPSVLPGAFAIRPAAAPGGIRHTDRLWTGAPAREHGLLRVCRREARRAGQRLGGSRRRAARDAQIRRLNALDRMDPSRQRVRAAASSARHVHRSCEVAIHDWPRGAPHRAACRCGGGIQRPRPL